MDKCIQNNIQPGIENFIDRIICGDSAEVLPTIPSESIHLVLTDPPYGIGMMQRNWDLFPIKPATQSQLVTWLSPGMKAESNKPIRSFEELNEIVSSQGAYEHEKGFTNLPRQHSEGMIEFFIPIWRECLRILKPGGLAFVMSIPRADCMWRQAAALEIAGFNVNLSPILWVQRQGFPKSEDISKSFDRAAFIAWLKSVVEIVKCPDHKPDKKGICMWCEALWYWESKLTQQYKNKIISAAVGGVYSGVDGNVNRGQYVGYGKDEPGDNERPWTQITNSRLGTRLLASVLTRCWEPLTELERLDIWKERSVIALREYQKQQFAVGPDHQDLSLPPGVRVKMGTKIDPNGRTKGLEPHSQVAYHSHVYSGDWACSEEMKVLTAPSVDLARQYASIKSVQLKPSYEFVLVAQKPLIPGPIRDNVERYGVGGINVDAARIPFATDDKPTGGYGGMDIGIGKPGETQDYTGAEESNPAGRYPANIIVSQDALGERNSRYFSLEAWSKAHGYDADWLDAAMAGCVQIPKPTKSEKTCGGTVENKHSTVKPVKLGGWILALGCPPARTMLDPFCGSGSFLVSAVLGGFHYIGIDSDQHYVDISKARIAYAKHQIMEDPQLPLTPIPNIFTETEEVKR